MGGGTTKIGDPSGKDSARPLLTNDKIHENQNSLRTVFQKCLKFGDAGNDAIMLDNAEWLEKLYFIS